MSDRRILVYGAYGYTGELIARFAAERDMRPIVAGRDAARLGAVAARYGFEQRAFGLDDPRALDAALDGVGVVLHCAGPFSRTSRPMVDACLRTRTHYLDITGEIDVFEAMAARDHEAREAGVMLMPGVGFDVVPSDCLAAHLKHRLPDATHLVLGIKGLGKTSHGTATTMVESLDLGGRVRRGGAIVPIRLGTLVRHIDFGQGPELGIAIPWGDVSTAFHSTGIPNIEVYFPATRAMALGARLSSYAPFVLGSKPVQRFLKRRVDARPAGPTDAERARSKSFLYGEARNAAGKSVAARMTTPDGYTLTADSALAIAERVQGEHAAPGFSTPSTAYGADFILELRGVTREDL